MQEDHQAFRRPLCRDREVRSAAFAPGGLLEPPQAAQWSAYMHLLRTLKFMIDVDVMVINIIQFQIHNGIDYFNFCFIYVIVNEVKLHLPRQTNSRKQWK